MLWTQSGIYVGNIGLDLDKSNIEILPSVNPHAINPGKWGLQSRHQHYSLCGIERGIYVQSITKCGFRG